MSIPSWDIQENELLMESLEVGGDTARIWDYISFFNFAK